MKSEVLILDCGNKMAGEITTYLDNCLGLAAPVYDAFEKIPEQNPDVKTILLYILDDRWDDVYHRNNINAIRQSALVDYIIVISMHHQIKTAVNYIRLGAVDYIEINEHLYEKLGDTLLKLRNLISLQHNVASLNTRLSTRNKQFITSLSIIILLLAAVILLR